MRLLETPDLFPSVVVVSYLVRKSLECKADYYAFILLFVAVAGNDPLMIWSIGGSCELQMFSSAVESEDERLY